MAWTYSDWMTATLAWAVTALSQASKSFSVAGDKRKYLAVGEVVAVSGTNIGSYTVVAVAYLANVTTITVAEAIPSATVDGNVTAGPNDRIARERLDLHFAEVSALVSASVGSDATSYNAETLRAYLSDLRAERGRLARQAGGVLTRGRIAFRS